MKKMVYGIRKETIEIDKRNKNLIKQGCTLESDNQGEAFIYFDSEDEAINEFKKYSSRINDYGRFYLVEEYFIDETELEYDEEWEEWEPTGFYNVIKFSDLPDFN